MDRLIKAARDAIDAVFGNRKVPKSVTREALLELLDDIQMKLESLGDDD